MRVYICVYIYICVCVCVCVCGSRIRNFSLLDLSPISLLFVLLGKQGIQVLHLISLVEVSFYSAEGIDLPPAVFAMVTGCELLFPRQNLIESFKLSCTGVR